MYAQTDTIVKHQNWKSYHHLCVPQMSAAKRKMRAGEGLVPTPRAELRISGFKSSMLTKIQMKSGGTIPDSMINFTDKD